MTSADTTAVRLDLDMETGLVTTPGRMTGLEALQPNLQSLLADEGKQFAVIVLSKGDRRPVDIALTFDRIPQEIDLLTLKLAVKEFETGRRYDLHEGDGTSFALVYRDGQPRYRTLVSLSAAQMQRILRSYADPLGTFVHLIGEVETQHRYNPADYSPGAVYTESVALGEQSVSVPVPLVQADGTRAYQLSVTATPLPDGVSGGWGSAMIQVLNKNISITVASGAVVGADLSISPGTRSGGGSPSKVFVPHYLTSVDPARIDPITGGLELRIDIDSEAMSPTVFGTMPATVWRAKGVRLNRTWVNGEYWGTGTPETLTFLDAAGAAIGSHTLPTGIYNAPGSVTHGVGNFFVFVGRNQFDHVDLVWKTEPTAFHVRGPYGDVPVIAEPVPSGPTIRFDVSLLALGDEAESEVTRVSSQSFVIQLRRDLIPDTAPPSS